jgi:hypothetical protein
MRSLLLLLLLLRRSLLLLRLRRSLLLLLLLRPLTRSADCDLSSLPLRGRCKPSLLLLRNGGERPRVAAAAATGARAGDLLLLLLRLRLLWRRLALPRFLSLDVDLDLLLRAAGLRSGWRSGCCSPLPSLLLPLCLSCAWCLSLLLSLLLLLCLSLCWCLSCERDLLRDLLYERWMRSPDLHERACQQAQLSTPMVLLSCLRTSRETGCIAHAWLAAVGSLSRV